MGYNVLSGSVSVTHLTSVSGSFTGDGSGLENVEQFELFNAAAARIPFFKMSNGELALDGNSGFVFENSALTVPGLTSSVGIRLTNPISGAIAGSGSYLGLDPNGNVVVTSSLGGGGGGGNVSFSRTTITTTATASVSHLIIGVSASTSIEIRLPNASSYSDGQYFTIKDEAGNADANNIMILTSDSQTIDDVQSVTLESPFAAVNIYSNGTDKFFVY